MTKHTRGPWYLDEVEYDGIIRNIAGNPVASVGFGYPKKTAVANALLIADAPKTAAERDRLREVELLPAKSAQEGGAYLS